MSDLLGCLIFITLFVILPLGSEWVYRQHRATGRYRTLERIRRCLAHEGDL